MSGLFGDSQDAFDLGSLSVKEPIEAFRRKTKVMCTVDATCQSLPVLASMVDTGMNVVRLNFSDSNHDLHGCTMDNLHAVTKERPGMFVATVVDLIGEGLVVGTVQDGTVLAEGATVKIVSDMNVVGKDDCFAIGLDLTSLPVGTELAAGAALLEVQQSSKEFVMAVVKKTGALTTGDKFKPSIEIDGPILSPREVKDVLRFAIPRGVNFLAVPIRKSGDVKRLLTTLGPRGRHLRVMAKIETLEHVKSLDVIMDEAHSLLINAKALEAVMPSEKVKSTVDSIIARCLELGKSVTLDQGFSATPTCAEASRAAELVYAGVDCLFLEKDAVKALRQITDEVETTFDYTKVLDKIAAVKENSIADPEGVCFNGVKAAHDQGVALIVALTETGYTPRMISKWMPKQPVLALTAAESVSKHIQLVRGIYPMQVASFQGTEYALNQALERAQQIGLVKTGDAVVAVHGMKEEIEGHTNMMKFMTIM